MWPIFITATSVPIKQINKALIHLQDYEFDAETEWAILHTNPLPKTVMASIPPISIPESVPTSALTSATNAFASKSPNDVYLFLEENREKFKGLDLTAWNWIVIDEKGFETETCLLGSRVLPDDEEDGDGNGEVVGYKICRIPWTRAWLMLANLDIANMGFEEWVDEKRGPVDEDFGAWAWVGPFDGAEKEDEEVLAKRGEAVRQGVEGGYI